MTEWMIGMALLVILVGYGVLAVVAALELDASQSAREAMARAQRGSETGER